MAFGSSDTLTRGGVVEIFKSESTLSNIAKGLLDGKNAQHRCEEFSRIIHEPHMRFEVIQGWDSMRIAEHCRARTRTELQLTLRMQDSEFRYAFAATEFAGELITLSLRSLSDGFKTYAANDFVSPVLEYSNWDWNYMIGDDKPLTGFIQQIFPHAWAVRHGLLRGVQGNGYPWSTFYVAGLLTSAFIWIVLIFTAVLFPLIWIVERVAQQRTVVKIREFPFSILSLVASFTIGTLAALS